MRRVANAFAKVNFTLEVLGSRPDGYHDLRSLVVPVSLADEVCVEDADETSCEMPGFAENVPQEKNLAVKAVRLLQSIAGVKREAKIIINKKIPSGGGLGGGSADAAAVLNILNEEWNCGFSKTELAAYSAAVGSDVPALVLGGAVLMEGRGERVSPFVGGDFALHLALARPNVFASTPAVFKKCAISRLQSDGEILYNMHRSIRSKDADCIADALHNDLCEAAMELHPEIARAVSDLQRAAGRRATMSGSGAAVFTVGRNAAETEAMAKCMEELGYEAWNVRTCPVM
ncbi:MAG: 4-(cytidine 5'-diphospho)-2-C-methyl-D-erythritol kinase [Kiritimatiellae bacterium]|nr:4-(cytidine 5'-diphospho)-2-C-methyl-D-erythritol kinase [Kiritimatiellia bacterium]